MVFEQILEWLYRLFGRDKRKISKKEYRENQKYNDEYIDINGVGLTAIFSQRLSSLAVSDSTAEIDGQSLRADMLNDALSEVWKKIKKITSSALGCGGCAIVPYIKNGKLYFDTVKQNRIIIHEKDGDKITGATILSESKTINDKVYYRFTDYVINENKLYITNRTVNEFGNFASVDEWENIQDIAIANVDRAPFGFIKSPIDNRKDSDNYGVPVTYGCETIIADIVECMKQTKEEFELKKVRLQVDERAFDIDPKTGKRIFKDKLFMKGHSEDGSLFNIFDPALRESSYHARLLMLFELLEKKVGTSKGILTAPASFGATATEIKAAMSDTFSVISDRREAIEAGLNDFIYACDVLLNFYSASPLGKYEIKYNWSYNLMESSTETWQQMKDLQSIGGMSKAELRSWVTNEDTDTAQKAVDKITEKEPNLTTLMGMNE